MLRRFFIGALLAAAAALPLLGQVAGDLVKSPASVAVGGTGITSGTVGGILVFNGTTSIISSNQLVLNALVLGGGVSQLPATLGSLGTTTQVLHGNASGAPTFGAVSLTADVSGILPGANGGTGNGFFAVSGPATSLKTFTFPNASSTVLTSNAAVTVAQGGTGIASGTSGGVPYFSGTTTIASSAALTASRLVLGGGAGAAPTVVGSLGTTTQVLHGNAAGAPTFGAVTRDDVSVTLITDQFCFVVKEPTNGLSATAHDVASIYSERSRAITVTEVWCETDAGTATLNLQRDDGSAANMLSSDIVCDTGEQDSCASGCDVNTIAAAEDNVAVDNEIDLLIASVASAPTRLSLCVKYTID